MLRIVQSRGTAAKSYFTQGLAREDYYSQGQEIVGHWGGRGAERLGLSGPVTPEAFEALCDNRHPQTGDRLTPVTKSDRTVGYDFNFHAPKSVSVVYERTHDAAILGAHREAVAETMRELERETRTRVRMGGADAERVTGNLVWGEFVHFTARPVDGVPDPHLHAHCFVFNATQDEVEGKWKAAQFREIKRDAPYYEAAYHARVALKLEERGYRTERTAHGWELASVPKSVIAKFSRRTSQIETEAFRRGLTDDRDKDALGALTREAKTTALTRDELRALWEARLTGDERDALGQVARGDVVAATPPVTTREAVEWAAQHHFERVSVASERELCRTALRQGVGSVRVEEVQREFQNERFLNRAVGGRSFVTSREVLSEERSLVAYAREGRGSCRALVGPGGKFERDFLSPEQQRAVRSVWESPDRVMVVRGRAGTGKTTLMQEAIRGIESAGKRVYTFAPSAEASRGVLRSEGFSGAETVAKLLEDEKLQRQLRGQVLWCDEAGLLGSRTLHQVFQLAERVDARVILSGDSSQHGAVDRGSGLWLLENYAGITPAEISQIRRQTGEYRTAVADLSAGRVAAGFDQLDRLGMVVEAPDASRYQRLAEDYVQARREGKSVLVISPTHAEGEHVTTVLRETLRASGDLGAKEQSFVQLRNHNWTAAERQDVLRFQAGDVVQFLQNAPGFRRGERLTVAEVESGQVWLDRQGTRVALPTERAQAFQVYETAALPLASGDRIRITQNGQTADGKHRLNNGSLYEVNGFNRQGDLKLANGWVIDRDFGHLAHGYCTTSHASQGKTVDRVFVAQSTQSLPATSLEQFYVSASRGRQSVTIYTDDKSALREAVQESGRRMSATELVAATESPPQSLRERVTAQFARFHRHAAQACRSVRTQWDAWRDRTASPERRWTDRIATQREWQHE